MASSRGRQPKTKAAPKVVIANRFDVVLHEKQQEFFECPLKVRCFHAGVGSGKSIVGAYDIIEKAESGTLNMVIAPSYKMLERATERTFKEIAVKLGVWDETQHFKADKRCILRTGAEFLFCSCDDPDSLRGPTCRRAWMDECQKIKSQESYNIIRERLRWGGELGYLTATFTPNGKEHWTYTALANTNDPHVASFNCMLRDNPFVSEEFVEAQYLKYGTGAGGLLRARQELEGEFLCVEGAEWGPECFGPEIWFKEWPHSDEEIRAFTLDSSKGVGGKSGDYSCFAMGKLVNGLLYVKFNMDNTRDVDIIADEAVVIQEQFKPSVLGIEGQLGLSYIGPLIGTKANAKNMFMVVQPMLDNTNKEVRIRRLTSPLRQGMFRFFDDDQTKLGVAQLEVFPHGEHDDAPDSLDMLTQLYVGLGCVQESEYNVPNYSAA